MVLLDVADHRQREGELRRDFVDAGAGHRARTQIDREELEARQALAEDGGNFACTKERQQTVYLCFTMVHTHHFEPDLKKKQKNYNMTWKYTRTNNSRKASR